MFTCGYNLFRSCLYLTSLTPVLSAPVRVRTVIFFIRTFDRHQGGSPRTLPENWGKNRLKKYKIDFSRKTEDPKVQEVLQPLRTAVKEQEDFVRSLKESGAPELDVKKAENELESRKKNLEAKELELAPSETGFVQARMADLLNRRFYIKQSFEIYGGVAGLLDFGDLGVKMQNNILALWRSHFVKEDDMLEACCSSLTPENVLKSSGHVDRFADVMVKDLKNGECFRVNHLIKNHLEKMMADENVTSEQCAEYEDIIVKLDGCSKKEMNTLLRKFDIKSPNTGNDLSDAVDFNLMMNTSMDPRGNNKGYLRPETAQGIFANFKHFVKSDQCRLPFAIAQIGVCYRKEISPGPLRLREFKMAEIEHFIDPRHKEHPKFDKVKDLNLMLYSACNQKDGVPAVLTTIGDAVEKGVVANETLGYFMARICQFLIAVGINPEKLRFRQHASNEMAHYATDCWDAETKLASGWIECVGCADRSCYDLEKHMDATGVRLTAKTTFKEPTVQVTELKPQMAVIKKAYKKDSRDIIKALKKLNEEETSNMEKLVESKNEYKLCVDGKEFSIVKDMIVVSRGVKTINVEDVVPFVIESSFGILRIVYSIWEHNFRMRTKNAMRTYFALPPVVAPYKCSILPLSDHPDFSPLVTILREKFKKDDVFHHVSNSNESIGRRYTRSDEMAVPFGITIDFDSLKKPFSVTLRERDTMEQIRVPLDQIVPLIQDLTSGERTWNSARSCYPKFEHQKAAKPG